MRRVALATVLLGAIALTSAAQQAVRVTGRVVSNDDTRTPIANARVSATSPAAQGSAVLTDGDGRFAILLSASPSRITIAASKTGYAKTELTAPAGQEIEVRLPRGAVISGRVLDTFGDPVVGASVLAETGSRLSDVPPAARAMGRDFAIRASKFTDDRGEYRMGSLSADTYKVAVLWEGEIQEQDLGGGLTAYSPKVTKRYFPDAETSETAESLTVAPGDDRPGIDFVVPPGSGSVRFRTMIAPPGPTPPSASSPAAKGVVRGRVLTTDGRPVQRAQVRALPDRPPAPMPAPPAAPGADVISASRIGFQPNITTADDDGRFQFQGMGAGSYRLAALKSGFSPPGEAETFGPPPASSGLAVTLADGETRERADITLARWGTIAGRIFDELGEPVENASVQLMRIRYTAGRRRLVPVGGMTRLTDDLGRFRTYGVAPGQYIVSAAAGDVGSADLPGYTRSYYPGTADAADAQYVSIGASQDLSAIDFALVRAQTARVSGTLLDASGQPSTSGSVRLLTSQRSRSVTSSSIGARLMSDGRFEFPNVASGQYVIQVDRGRRQPDTEGEFGALPVTVSGGDITGLVVQTSVGSSIGGRIIFDSYAGAAPPRRNTVNIVPVPIDPDQSSASTVSLNIHEDWSFSVFGINGPRRLEPRSLPAGWTLKEIRACGIDVTDRPLAFGRSEQSLTDVEIVLTDRLTEITGTIADDHATPAPGAQLIVFATDRDRWYPASRFVRVARAGDDGGIALSGLPSGSYYAAAVAKLPPDGDDAWEDPAFLESLVPRATPVSLGEGQRRVLNLKIE